MNDLTSKRFKESLQEAIDLFNNQKWYEAHDAFEDIWNDLVGDERQIVQGILQVSVSQFHLNKGNLNGAMILLGEGLGRIKNRESEDLEIDYNFDNLDIGFNSKYLLDIASQIQGKEIEILLSDSASPALITDPDQDGVIFVLMPMRV